MSPVSGATATSTPAKAQGKPAAPRRKRGEGQWALGYREPLNKNEENKKFDDGLNVRQRIIDIYAKRGFDSIDPADLRGTLPLVRALHPAPPGHRRRQDRRPRAGRARRPLLHAPGAHRRRPAVERAAAGHLRHLRQVRPGHRRRHRPAEHPAALDRDRVGPRDLGGPGGRRPVHHRGLRRHAAGHPRLSPGGPGRRRADRRHGRRSPPSRTGTSATRRCPTCRASSSRRSAAARRSARTTRSTTSRSPPSATRRPARSATTCGSAAGCPPTR